MFDKEHNVRLKLVLSCLITVCTLPLEVALADNLAETLSDNLAQAQVQIGGGNGFPDVGVTLDFGGSSDDYYESDSSYDYQTPPPPPQHAPPPPPAPRHAPPPPRRHGPPLPEARRGHPGPPPRDGHRRRDHDRDDRYHDYDRH